MKYVFKKRYGFGFIIILVIFAALAFSSCVNGSEIWLQEYNEKKSPDSLSEQEISESIEYDSQEYQKHDEDWWPGTKSGQEQSKPHRLIQVDDLLYFVRDISVCGETQRELCSIKKDGTGFTVVYDFGTRGCSLELLNIDIDQIMVEVYSDGWYHPAILNLRTKDLKVFNSPSQYSRIIYYDERFYYLDIKPDQMYNGYLAGDLFYADMDFNKTLVCEEVMFFEIYKGKIVYTRYLSKEYLLFACDLDGSNEVRLFEQALGDKAFSIHDSIIYSADNYGPHSDDYGTQMIDIFTGESKVCEPRINYVGIQFKSEYFFATELFGKDIYKISYNWEDIEIIAQYFCEILLFDDYLYLIRSFSDVDEDVWEQYAVKDAIARINLDGGSFEKLVTVEFKD